MKHAVDANIFIHGRKPDFQQMMTVPEVVEELRSDSGERSYSVANIDVREPTERAVNEVRNLSKEMNSPTSEADEKLLALASDLGGVLVTDDKALQNLALHMEVPIKGFLEDPVEEKRKWEMVCPTCGRKTEKFCKSCGKEPIPRKQV